MKSLALKEKCCSESKKDKEILERARKHGMGAVTAPIMSSIKGCWRHMSGCLIHRYTSCDCIQPMLHTGSGARQTEQRCSSKGAYGIARGKRTDGGVQRVSSNDIRVQIRNKSLHMRGPFSQYLLSSYRRLGESVSLKTSVIVLESWAWKAWWSWPQ